MKKLIIRFNAFFLLILVLISCSRRKNEICEDTLTHTNLVKAIKPDTVQKGRGTVSPGFYEPTEEDVKRWKKNVIKNADECDFNQLWNSYYNRENANEMFRYAEIMVRYHRNEPNYKQAYFDFLDESNLKNKKTLMKKAIRYLKEVATNKKIDEITRSNANCALSKIFNEGTYVKRDTVIANYLYNNSAEVTNLDSIIKIRKYKEW